MKLFEAMGLDPNENFDESKIGSISHVEDKEKRTKEELDKQNQKDMIINKFFNISENDAYTNNKLASRIATRNYSEHLGANNGRMSENSLFSIDESKNPKST